MGNKRTLIVAPHPDDEWIGCGCRILKETEEGVPVKVLFITGRDKKRVKLSKKLSKKYGYEVEFLDEQELDISEEQLTKFLKKHVKSSDCVFIPSFDDHPDHQFINRICLENLQNKNIYEMGIYNNSRNIFVRCFSKLRTLFTKRGYTTFRRGRGQTLSYRTEIKAKYIVDFREYPRDRDLFRKVETTKKKRPPERLNIAYLTKDYNTGTVDAGFKGIIGLAKEMKKKGHHVYMISNRGYASWYEPPAVKKHEIFQGIHIYRPYGMKWFDNPKFHFNPTLLFNRFIAQALGVRYVQKKHRIKFDIIHSSSSAPILFGASILSKLFAPKAQLFHTIRSESMYGVSKFKAAKILNLASTVFVPLNSLKKKLISEGCNPYKIRIIRSAIPVEKFTKSQTLASTLKKKWNIKDEKVVLYYGKGGPLKGVDDLLNAVNYIPPSTKVKFLLFHPVVWLPHIVSLAKEHKYREKISLNVEKINVPDYLAMADIQVLPLKSVQGTEGNPLTLLEGMAAGIPIVTTDLPELREIVEPEIHVLMAKPRNPESLAEEIMRLLKSTDLQKKLVANGKKVVRTFNIKTTSLEHLDSYNKSFET